MARARVELLWYQGWALGLGLETVEPEGSLGLGL